MEDTGGAPPSHGVFDLANAVKISKNACRAIHYVEGLAGRKSCVCSKPENECKLHATRRLKGEQAEPGNYQKYPPKNASVPPKYCPGMENHFVSLEQGKKMRAKDDKDLELNEDELQQDSLGTESEYSYESSDLEEGLSLLAAR